MERVVDGALTFGARRFHRGGRAGRRDRQEIVGGREQGNLDAAVGLAPRVGLVRDEREVIPEAGGAECRGVDAVGHQLVDHRARSRERQRPREAIAGAAVDGRVDVHSDLKASFTRRNERSSKDIEEWETIAPKCRRASVEQFPRGNGEHPEAVALRDGRLLPIKKWVHPGRELLREHAPLFRSDLGATELIEAHFRPLEAVLEHSALTKNAVDILAKSFELIAKLLVDGCGLVECDLQVLLPNRKLGKARLTLLDGPDRQRSVGDSRQRLLRERPRRLKGARFGLAERGRELVVPPLRDTTREEDCERREA